MKEIMLLFVGSYTDADNIPTLKTQVIEYLGNRMIEDKCEDSPLLKLKQSIEAADVSAISQMVSNCPGNSMSVLYIKADTEEEVGMLSKLFVELKPTV